MKKILIILGIIFVSLMGSYVAAEESQTTTLSAGVEFNWINMDQVQRDEVIETYKEKIFGSGEVQSIKKKEFRETYKDFLKDPNVKTHYRLIVNGVKETKDAYLCGFFIRYSAVNKYDIHFYITPRIIRYSILVLL